jgi:twitching motility protein PilT
MTAALASVRLEETLRYARARNASDIHLVPGMTPVIRIDGALNHHQATVALCRAELEALTNALLDDRARDVLAQKGDVSVSYRHGDLGAFRIHAFQTEPGISIAIRLLSKEIPTLEKLDLPTAIADFSRRPHGLVLFTGPAGSGKSTALAALVDGINRRDCVHVITLEDPLEHRHECDRALISHREIGRDAPTFASALHGALRSDPDVILIGELRDAETMQAALTAAETGHLVLATVHTSTAPQTIDRIVGSFAGSLQDQVRIQLAQTLIGIVCLRLVRRSGRSGRRAAAEIMIANDAVRAAIRDGKTHHLRNVMLTSRPCGMQTLEQHLRDLILRGEITEEDARDASERPAEVSAAGT